MEPARGKKATIAFVGQMLSLRISVRGGMAWGGLQFLGLFLIFIFIFFSSFSLCRDGRRQRSAITGRQRVPVFRDTRLPGIFQPPGKAACWALQNRIPIALDDQSSFVASY